MPEGLQMGDTGQMLEERVGELETVIGELEQLDEPEETEHDEEDDDESISESQIEAFRGRPCLRLIRSRMCSCLWSSLRCATFCTPRPEVDNVFDVARRIVGDLINRLNLEL